MFTGDAVTKWDAGHTPLNSHFLNSQKWPSFLTKLGDYVANIESFQKMLVIFPKT